MTGFFNLNKPEGMNSTALVNRVKHLTRTPCGHMGTLDPLASGVLPVGVGNATRLFEELLSKKKTYRARFVFGATTDTLDREGTVVKGGRIPSKEEIVSALGAFTGEIGQIPPKYSAVSVGGRRGYALARAGADFVLPEKRVTVYDFQLTGQEKEDEFCFEIVCGGGTYIRALARDLAHALGTQGYMSSLCRTASGPFKLETAIDPAALSEESLAAHLIPTQRILDLPVLEGEDERIFHGVRVPVSAADGRYQLFRGGVFYGIARVEDGLARAEKKLC